MRHIQRLIIQIFITFATIPIIGMELYNLKKTSSQQHNRTISQSSRNKRINPTYTISCFNPESSLKRRDVLTKFLATQLTIAPDDKSIFASTDGKVYEIQLYKYPFITEPTLLFQHPSTPYPPMLRIKEEPTKSRLIAAIGNYCDKTKHKWLSQLLLYKCKKESYRVIDFKHPLQTLEFSPHNNKLVLAGFESIILFDTDNYSKSICALHSSVTGNRLVDLAISPDGNKIIVNGKYGTMQLIFIDPKTYQLRTVKNILCQHEIQKLSYPTLEAVFFITHTTSNIINLYDYLEKDDTTTLNKHHTSDAVVQTTQFSASKIYNRVSFDQCLQDYLFTAHWSKKNIPSYKPILENTHVIKAYYQKYTHLKNENKNHKRRTYILCAPQSDKPYDIISKSGQLQEKHEYICHVALKYPLVTALLSSGKIHVWKIGPDKITPTKQELSTNNTTWRTQSLPCSIVKQPATDTKKSTCTKTTSKSKRRSLVVTSLNHRLYKQLEQSDSLE